MCGIFGVITNSSSSIASVTRHQLLKSLFLLSESRGKEASGVFTLEGSKLNVFKSSLNSSSFIKTGEFLQILKGDWRLAIGHSRLATNGDLQNNLNNQPVISKKIIGVHNGIITNEKVLWAKSKSNPLSQLDSESLFSLINSYRESNYSLPHAVSLAFRLLEGSATIASFDSSQGDLVLATNTGSLYYSTHPHGHYTVFASEKYILSTALKRLLISTPIKQLPADNLLYFKNNAYKGELMSFAQPLPKKSTPQPTTQLHIIDHSTYPKTFNHLISGNRLSSLRTHDFNYHRIYSLKRCTRCILPNTTPFIQFDHSGVCNYCLNHKPFNYLGKAALLKKISPLLAEAPKEANCLVGFSGGRDSSYGLHLIKKELGLNPIAFTYDWGMLSDLGRQNAARITGKLGIEHIIVSADIAKKRHNIRQNILAWLNKPDPGIIPLFMAGDKEAEFHINQLARRLGIKLVIFLRGNNYEKEEFKAGLAGVKNADPGGVIHDLSLSGKLQLGKYYAQAFLKNPSLINSSLPDTIKGFASTYLIPHHYLYLWHYLPWKEDVVTSTIKEKYNWQSPTDNPSTWRIDDGSPAFYNYIYYHYQGFTENDSLRSHQIREGVLTRDEAWRRVCEENKPRYTDLQWYFESLNLDGHSVLKIIDKIKPKS